jgi:RNA polymerase sigma-70 factor, ECF subfamily
MHPVARPKPSPVRTELGPLVTLAIGGDRSAKEALYRAQVDDVTRVVTFLLGRSSEVEDVVQESFLRAFAALPQLVDRDRFGAWLGRIAANLARTRLRRRRFLRLCGMDRGQDDVTLASLAAPGTTPEQHAELVRIGKVLERLSADERAAWILRSVEGSTLAEIAEALDLSLATVKRRLSSADSTIASALGDAPREAHA